MALITSVLTRQPACRLVCRKVEECAFKVGDLVRKQVQHGRQLELQVLTAPGIVRQVLFRRGYWVCRVAWFLPDGTYPVFPELARSLEKLNTANE